MFADMEKGSSYWYGLATGFLGGRTIAEHLSGPLPKPRVEQTTNVLHSPSPLLNVLPRAPFGRPFASATKTHPGDRCGPTKFGQSPIPGFSPIQPFTEGGTLQ
ncbi:hypothetical protein EGR_00485 [Echinococcus granulosus]|uniref:Uncharacterized protein n=1 Tax=Echinococcus granulosus TaxID=6210 RepID=W6USB5_ECHGR|nr:hypothetical protein EGR_00485 [Echinococcus granulosus]EUB64535.1 hypothetical protein EGR_00485 [Echinococcus granulosus]